MSARKGFFDEMGKNSVVPSPSNYKISVFKKTSWHKFQQPKVCNPLPLFTIYTGNEEQLFFALLLLNSYL